MNEFTPYIKQIQFLEKQVSASQHAFQQRDAAYAEINSAVQKITQNFPEVEFTGDLGEAVTWLLKEVHHWTDMACHAEKALEELKSDIFN